MLLTQRHQRGAWTYAFVIASYLTTLSFAHASEESASPMIPERTWEQAFSVDASGLSKAEDDIARVAIEQRIYQRGRGEFDLRDINLLAAPLHEVNVRLVIKWTSEAQESYAIVSEVQLAGTLIEAQLEPSICEFCTENELIERSTEHLRKVMEILPTLVVDQRKAPEISALTWLSEDTTGSFADSPATPQQRETSKLRIVGYSLSGTGILALGAGIGVVFKGKTGTFDSKGYQPSAQELQTGGVALAIIGAALIAGGVVPLAVDFARVRKQRKLAAYYPSLNLGQQSVGVSLAGQF